MTSFYIAQWCNPENVEDTGVKCFSKFEDASFFLHRIINTNFERDHINKRWKPEIIVLDHLVDPEGLFPYVYKITKITMLSDSNYSFY